MPIPAQMKMTATQQGAITQGDNTPASVGLNNQQQFVDQATLSAFDMNIFVPTDPYSSQATGQPTIKPAVVFKALSKSSPLAWTSASTGEVFTTVEVDFYWVSAGQQQKYFTITFSNAVVMDAGKLDHNVLDPDRRHYPDTEFFAFTYTAVTWTQAVAGTTATYNYTTTT